MPQLHSICRHCSNSQRGDWYVSKTAQGSLMMLVRELQAGWLINLVGLRRHVSQLRRHIRGSICGALMSCISMHAGCTCSAARTLHAHCNSKAVGQEAAHHKRVTGHCVTCLHIPQPLQLWQLRPQRAQEAQCRKQEGIQEPYVSSLQSLLRTWRHMWEVSVHPQSFASHPPPGAADLTQATLMPLFTYPVYMRIVYL